MLLQTELGSSRVLGRPDSRRLWVLNPCAAALWDLHASGLDAAALADLLAAQFGLADWLARAQVAQLLADWRQSGLLDARGPLPPTVWTGRPAAPQPADLASVPAAGVPILPLAIAGTRVGLAIEAPTHRAALTALLAPLRRTGQAPTDPVLQLRGRPDDWRLAWAGATADLSSGHAADAALVATLGELVEYGCRAEDRLLVIHGAGLALPDGTGLLLVAPGGSGKTTLAAALNAAGLDLLSDDVVPVNRDGTLAALGLPLCLKAGSWPVLARHRPDLAAAPSLRRHGQAIRYLPPRGATPLAPIAPRLLLFPRYQPGSAPRTEALTPEQALRGLVEAEAVIRNLTQAKLDALARWVGALPAHALTYPDLDSGMGLVAALREEAEAGA